MSDNENSAGRKVNGIQLGCGLVIALIAAVVIGVNLLRGGVIEAPRQVVHERLAGGAAAEPYQFWEVGGGIGGEPVTVGFPVRLRGLVQAADGAAVEASILDGMVGLGSTSAPILLVMGPDDQITRLAASAWPSVGDGVRERTIDELAALAAAVDPSADLAAIRLWLAEAVKDFERGSPSASDELVRRKAFGKLDANITLTVRDAVTGLGVRQGISATVGLVP
ncbi:MAG: hypothetical protein AAGG07_05705 [Planctomycetota bacterium]